MTIFFSKFFKSRLKNKEICESTCIIFQGKKKLTMQHGLSAACQHAIYVEMLWVTHFNDVIRIPYQN